MDPTRNSGGDPAATRRLARVVRSAVALLAACLIFGTLGQSWAGVVTFAQDPKHEFKSPGGATITSTGTYDPVNIYSVPGGFGVAFLLPPVPVEIARGGLRGGIINYRGTLEMTFPEKSKWSFKSADKD